MSALTNQLFHFQGVHLLGHQEFISSPFASSAIDRFSTSLPEVLSNHHIESRATIEYHDRQPFPERVHHYDHPHFPQRTDPPAENQYRQIKTNSCQHLSKAYVDNDRAVSQWAAGQHDAPVNPDESMFPEISALNRSMLGTSSRHTEWSRPDGHDSDDAHGFSWDYRPDGCPPIRQTRYAQQCMESPPASDARRPPPPAAARKPSPQAGAEPPAGFRPAAGAPRGGVQRGRRWRLTPPAVWRRAGELCGT